MILKKQLKEIKHHIAQGNIEQLPISKKGTFWQIDHSLKVAKAICVLLINSDPKEFSPKFSFAKWMILLSGYIPRGKGKAPKATESQDIKPVEVLHSKIEELENLLSKVMQLSPKHHFDHPYFGHINLSWSKTFLAIHTNHHLKIIRDIAKSKG